MATTPKKREPMTPERREQLLAEKRAKAAAKKKVPVGVPVTSAKIDDKREEEGRFGLDVVVEYENGKRAKIAKNSLEYKILAAERVLAQRALARRRFLPFIQHFAPQYKVGWCHELLASKLEKFVEDCHKGLSPRLMVTFPPRHGKSEQTSRKLPAFALGHYPYMEIILASYGITLAEGFSKHVIGLLRDPEYQELFPKTKLHPMDQAMSGWRTTANGGMKPAGVGVGVTGMGAHMLIIDDPFKDRQDADSDTVRNTTWDWYTDVAQTRLAPGGGVLVINTRWHDDDLSGRLLALMNDEERDQTYIDQWDLVNFAALATDDEYITLDNRLVNEPEPGARLVRQQGDALHPDRYPRELLLRMKANMHPRSWNALFQQKPVPDDGEFFCRDQIIEYDPGHGRADGTAYIACDFAISEKTQADWTVVAVGLHMPNDTIHIDDIIRFRSGDAFRIVDTLLTVFKRYEVNNPVLGVEDGQIWKSISALFFAEARKRHIYPNVELLKPLTDKRARARPLQGRMQMHMVTFSKNAAWLDKTSEEMLRFPTGVHDDIVDALAWMVQLVITKQPPIPLTERRKKANYGVKTTQQLILEQLLKQDRGEGYMSA
jgi:predicted phage terminase large subunit-like protein